MVQERTVKVNLLIIPDEQTGNRSCHVLAGYLVVRVLAAGARHSHPRRVAARQDVPQGSHLPLPLQRVHHFVVVCNSHHHQRTVMLQYLGRINRLQRCVHGPGICVRGPYPRCHVSGCSSTRTASVLIVARNAGSSLRNNHLFDTFGNRCYRTQQFPQGSACRNIWAARLGRLALPPNC